MSAFRRRGVSALVLSAVRLEARRGCRPSAGGRDHGGSCPLARAPLVGPQGAPARARRDELSCAGGRGDARLGPIRRDYPQAPPERAVSVFTPTGSANCGELKPRLL